MGGRKDLAGGIRDGARLQRAKAMLFGYLDSRATDTTFPFWLFDDIAWEQRAALGLSAGEKDAVIAVLERVLASRADQSDPTRFDPHTAQDAADRLGRWRRLQGQDPAPRRAAGTPGRAIE